MTTLDPHVSSTHPDVAATASSSADALVNWVTTADHKRIGRMFIVGALIAGVAVAVIAAVLGLDRADSSRSMVDIAAIPQFFAAYRVGLVMCVAIPLMLGLAVAVVPLQVGARALAFGRMAVTGFWMWLFGAVVVIVSIAANGGPGGGNQRFVSLFQTAHIVLVLGLLAVTVSVAATILTTRAPGMNMRRVPPFTWSVLVFCLGLVLILPAVVGMLAYTWVDYRHGRVGYGGTKALGSWLGFAYSQPATIVYVIPAFGFVLEAIATATRKRLPMRGIAFAGVGLLGVAALPAMTRTHFGLERNVFHGSFGTFLKQAIPYALFHLLPVLGGVTVLGIGLLALMSKPKLISPLLFGFFGAGLATLGIAGNALGAIGDVRVGGTVYEEAMTVLILGGVMLTALGAITYWSPKLTGGAVDDRKVLPLALLGALGVVLAGVPYIIAGFAKQPAEAMAFDYGGPQDLWNILVGVGHVLIALTVIGVLALHLAASRRSDPATDDPWDAQTLEWATPSPAPDDNFSAVHSVMSPEPLLDLKPGGQS